MLPSNVFPGSALGRSLLLFTMVLALSSCANLGSPVLQPQINALVVAHDAKAAAQMITAQRADYGSGNYMLYHLDRGLVSQLAGDRLDSINSLDKAKTRYDELYTKSLGKEAATWILNDNAAPYRAPEYERVLINIFQAMNYLQAGELDETLVEMRDLDSKFPVNIDAFVQKKRMLDDNGFARLLAGILCEARGKDSDLNDALIAYKQALAVYDVYYGKTYVPLVLQEGLIRLATVFNDPDLASYLSRFAGRHVVSDPHKAVVYFIEAVGFSPVKIEGMLPIPLENGVVAKIAFPSFVRRPYVTAASEIVLEDAAGVGFHALTELGDDIESLAEKDLDGRKALILTKALLRPTIKYLVEHNQQAAIEKRQGPLAGLAFGLVSSLYNFMTEQADLRSWQALPGQIRIARLALPAGIYHMHGQDFDGNGNGVDAWDEGTVTLVPGEVRCIFRRGIR
ncbi:MAG: hypothetical protein HQL17_02165 [Candidatus Omnitrophica bacterium]|nr:hypothetical protein [Candidatus Omnitrophota bacterium]